MRRSSLSAFLLVLLGACGGGSTPTTDAATTSDSGAVVDSGGSTDDAATSDAGSTVDAGSNETTYMLETNYCFTFATATSMDSMSHTCGDMNALAGFMVDLAAPGDAFCAQTGTFTSLSDVPTSYASCAWMPYVEGADSLANHAFIVRDASGAHHYRMRIVSNALPALVFSFDAID